MRANPSGLPEMTPLVGGQECEVLPQGEPESPAEGGSHLDPRKVQAVGLLQASDKLPLELQKAWHNAREGLIGHWHEELASWDFDSRGRLHRADVEIPEQTVAEWSVAEEFPRFAVSNRAIEAAESSVARVQVFEALADGPASWRRPPVELIVREAGHQIPGIRLDGLELAAVLRKLWRQRG